MKEKIRAILEELAIMAKIFILLAIVATIIGVPAYLLGFLENPIIFIFGNATVFTIIATMLGLKQERENKIDYTRKRKREDWD